MVRHGHLNGITSLTGMPEFCEACVLGKMKKQPFPRSRTVPRGPLDIVSCDVGGPVQPISEGGFRYWITLVDHYKFHVWVLLAKKKSHVRGLIRAWRKHVEAHFRTQIANWEFRAGWIRFFRTDGGGEFTSKQMEDYFRREGIIHETTAPYTPEQDGVAERMNQTLTTRANTNLVASHLPRKYWNRAMLHSAYTINRSPASAHKGQTPHEGYYDRPVDLHHMHPFGCPAYPLVDKQHRKGKFANKERHCVFIGYHEGNKAYDLLDIDTGKIITSRHVKFNDASPAPQEICVEPPQTTSELEEIAQSLRKNILPYYEDDVPQVVTKGMSIPDMDNPRPLGSVGDMPTVSSPVEESISAKSEPTSTVVPPSAPPLRRVAGMCIPPTRSPSRSPSPPPVPADRRSSRARKPAQHPNEACASSC
jgi:hypothetical protein